MRRSVVGSVVGFILVLAALGIGGFAVWNAGYQQGLIQAADTGAEVVVRGPYFPGFGFGLFGLFFAFLFFGFLARLFFWRGGWGGPGYWSRMGDPEHPDNHLDQRMREWHDQAHVGGSPDPAPRE